MAKTFHNEAAEREANEIAFRFQDSHDVVADMSRAYHTDFTGIRMHEDAAAQSRVRAAGTDALAKGADLYFREGILDGNDQASRGLIAHELAHTMQQGIVDGAVAEHAPMGAEQGGFLDWVRGAFRRRPRTQYEYLGGAKSTDQASLDYMAAMRAREAELTREKRAAAMGGLAPVGRNELPEQQVAEMNALTPGYVAESDRQWQNYGADDISGALRISYAYQALKHRQSSEAIGRLNKEIEEQAFAGSSDSYRDYYQALDASGADFQQMLQGTQEFEIDKKKYRINDAIGGVMQDIYSIASQYMLADGGLDYIQNLSNGVQGAQVFRDTGISPLNYVLTTLMTSEGAHAMIPMIKEEGFTQTGAAADARRTVAKEANKNLLIPMMMERMTPERRAELPAAIQTLYMQYMDIQRRITEALAARGAGA